MTAEHENAPPVDGGPPRRRRRLAAGIAIGAAAVIAVLIVVLLGPSIARFVGLGDPAAPQQYISGCAAGADGDGACSLEAAAASLDGYWRDVTAALDVSYSTPGVSVFDGATESPCSMSDDSAGPFYCSAETTIYLDTVVFEQLRTERHATGGPLAQFYVIAHEWGHHVQKLDGTLARIRDGSGPHESAELRTELQADCYAGAWIAFAAKTPTGPSRTPLLLVPSQQELVDALSAVAEVGEHDAVTSSGDDVVLESWTRGSADQRQRWLSAGYANGPSACDTFTVDAGQL